jgi:hypothetical protein
MIINNFNLFILNLDLFIFKSLHLIILTFCLIKEDKMLRPLDEALIDMEKTYREIFK